MDEEFHVFALFDKDGYPIGFYPSDIWPEPPKGSVEISIAQWREFLDNQGYRKYVDGNVVPTEPKAV
jgi:hypothetical protein